MDTFHLKNGRVLKILTDEDPDSPRNWDNACVMVCLHKRYALGDKHEYKSGDYSGWEALKEQIMKDHDPLLIDPLYMYDHSGITISTSKFDCQWDSGQIGWVFISREKAYKEWRALPMKRVIEDAQLCMDSEVETYDQYLRGDVYGFVLKDEAGEHVDSCGGFYGSDILTNGMMDHFSKDIQKELKKALGIKPGRKRGSSG